MAFTRNTFNNVSSGGGGTIKIWSYINSSDTVATIMAADYFNPMRFALNQNDVIFTIGSDASELVRVTSAVNATSVTVVSYDSVPAGTIVNADISATAAIAFSKLAALASGSILVGSAGTVPTVVPMSGDVAIIASGATTIQALAVDAGKLALAIPRTVTVAVSAAEVLGMFAAPKLIVAAGAANTLHIVTSVVYEFAFVTAQFANGGVVSLQYGTTIEGLGTDASADTAAAVFTGVAADHTVGAAGELATGASSATVAQGLYLSNETAAFITGDSTLNVHVTYSTVTTAV